MTAGESIDTKVTLPEPVGADAAALAVALRGVSDLGSDADALFLLMTSPWRKAVLSTRRTVLLEGVQLAPGARVLEIAPAAGSITRWLLEAGHSVVALCRTELEAELVSARCDGLDHLEVRVGDASSVSPDERFDAVVHLPLAVDAAPSIVVEDFVELVAAVLRPGGTLVWSFRNDVGLDALVGLADAQGRPASVDAARTDAVAGTHHGLRAAIAERLVAAGFDAQDWAGCYPDAASPSALVADELFDDPAAVRLVDPLVGSSLRAGPGSLLLLEPRHVLERLVAAGVGASVAPGFVVHARRPGGEGPVPEPESTVLARLSGAERLRPWQQRLVVERADGGIVVRRRRLWPNAGVARQAWLANEVTEVAELVRGETLEQRVADAVERGDLTAVRRELTRWLDWLRARALPEGTEGGPNPFCAPGAAPVLPPELLDVVLSNFVVDEAGELHFVDDEWRADGGVSLSAVAVRALCRFAHQLVTSGRRLPWPASATADEIAETLGRSIGLAFDRTDVARWHAAEAELSGIVYGVDRHQAEVALESEGATSRLSLAVTRRLPYASLVQDVRRMEHDIALLQDGMAAVRTAHDNMDSERSALRDRVAALESELDASTYALAAHERLAAALRADIEQIHDLRRALDAAQRAAGFQVPLVYHRLRAKFVGPAGGSRHLLLVRARRAILRG